MKEIPVVLVGIICIAASICVLFYPQDTDCQKAVKLGCHMGTVVGFIIVIAIIQKLFL